jgi:hypothetical protein
LDSKEARVSGETRNNAGGPVYDNYISLGSRIWDFEGNWAERLEGY